MSAEHPPQLPTNFDRVARPYRWLEVLTFGRALEACRERLLPRSLAARDALVLGDGDGRFLVQLLRGNPHVTATAIDSSAAMLRLLEQRCRFARERLCILHCDALDGVCALPASQTFDLIATHFFLDCLTQTDLDQLAAVVATRTRPGALWIISEFHVPAGWRGLPQRVVVRLLYAAFGLLTGLRVTRLPDHASALERAGFTRIDRRLRLAGLLTSELWQKQAAPGRPL